MKREKFGSRLGFILPLAWEMFGVFRILQESMEEQHLF